MNIALLGHGNMGTEVERLLAGTSHRTSVIEASAFDAAAIKDADVVIDFTSPEVVLNNIRIVSAAGKNMVVGTTGWYENLDEVTRIVKERDTGLIYGQNFSIGAHIFFALVAEAARLASTFGGYDPSGFEIHHAGKKDSPSGTALRTAKEILDNFPAKKTLQTNRLNRQIRPEELHFSSIRAGRNPGFHRVVFDSAADEITISHSAHNRSGFAAGAIVAAEFIHGKKGMYTFDDVMRERRNLS